MTVGTFFGTKEKEAIRAADNKGKKQIVIGGILFTIERYSRNVTYQTGGAYNKGVRQDAKTVKRTEHWLRVMPKDGRLVPMTVMERYKDYKPRTANHST